MRSKQRITVVETGPYLNDAKRILSQQERSDIKSLLSVEPTCGTLLRGTGGLRKMRMGRSQQGKSGGARVVYYFADDMRPIFLLAVFAKNEKDNLTQAERNDLKKVAQRLKGF